MAHFLQYHSEKNRVMTYLEFQRKFGTETQVMAHYILLRYAGKPICPHCQSEQVYQKKDRLKVFHCAGCSNTFSIFKDTIFENSSTDMVKWMYAIHLFLNGKKGISALQLQREIGVTYKTAWRMFKQIRTAMGNKEIAKTFEAIVEIDEVYIGGKPRKRNKGNNDKGGKRGRGTKKTAVVGIIDRKNKQVHAKVSLPNAEGKKLSSKQLLTILNEVVKQNATVISDELSSYKILSRSGFTHLSIDHSKQFANGHIHTNGIESFWATLKRGIYGIYHSVSIKHLQNYVNEFCFRYNNRNNENAFDLLLTQTIN